MNDRKCCICGTPIYGCFGFTKAGDLLDWLEGRRIEIPREVCGKCGYKGQWNEKGEWEPMTADELMIRAQQ